MLWLEGTPLAVVSKSVRADFPTEEPFPFDWNSSAELPATNGAAIDVPDRIANEPREMGMVDTILPPGAATAGLKKKSLERP